MFPVYTIVKNSTNEGLGVKGAETLVGNLILPLKAVGFSGCYFLFNNIILTNIEHAWKVHLTALYFTGIYYRAMKDTQ